jgi:DNA polymerase V
MCDHFASNPNNPGRTSTGGGGIYLKKIQEHFHGATFSIFFEFLRSMTISNPILFEARSSLQIPLVSAHVQAGFPSPADDHMERSIDLNEHLVKNPAATFFVRVQGESMRDAGISCGDILIVDRSVQSADNQIVVAMLDGDFTVKRFRKREERVFLEAENNAYPPIEVGSNQELVIWGAVTFVIHQPR